MATIQTQFSWARANTIGRAAQAAASASEALTGNDELRAEGKTDQLIGKVKANRREGRLQGRASREKSARVKL
jgi:uncharacterized protein YjbJ (UPF0337 family)